MKKIAMGTSDAIWRYNLSLDYLQGKTLPQDDAKSFELNAEAARLGHRDAILAMGWYYLNGAGVVQDYEKAGKWYRKSARHGEPRAMFSLGQIAYLERDFVESLSWFKRAAGAGHARSLYWIGKHYWFGRGVDPDKKAAMKLLHQAAGKKVIAATRVLRFLSRRRKYGAKIS